MLATALLALLAASTAAAAPCPATQRFQWAGHLPNAGWLSVGLSGYNNEGSWIDNGSPVYASGDYLRYVNTQWEYSGGAGTIKLSGFNKCLDAGLSPGNGTPLKVWDCYPGVMQQTWRVHDGVIELEGKGLCVDVPNGNTSPTVVQLWQCYPGNSNQKWATVYQ